MYIILNKTLTFPQNGNSGGQFTANKSPNPQLVPDWVRECETFIAAKLDGSAVEVPVATLTPSTPTPPNPESGFRPVAQSVSVPATDSPTTDDESGGEGKLPSDLMHPKAPIFRYRYPSDFPAGEQRAIEKARQAANRTLESKVVGSFEEQKAARIEWFWDVVSAGAAGIGRVAVGQTWDANRTRDALEHFAGEAAQAIRITRTKFSELRESDDWHALEEGMFASPARSETGPDTSDPEQAKRATTRSAWLEQGLTHHPEWSSDTDIAANKGPSYNTIQRYRSGITSSRDRYVRRKLAAAFACKPEEIPE
jgi:hypothetical protein